MVAPGRYRFHFPLETRDDLEQYLDVVWGVRIPKTHVCPNHSTPWDALWASAAVAMVVVGLNLMADGLSEELGRYR